MHQKIIDCKIPSDFYSCAAKNYILLHVPNCAIHSNHGPHHEYILQRAYHFLKPPLTGLIPLPELQLIPAFLPVYNTTEFHRNVPLKIDTTHPPIFCLNRAAHDVVKRHPEYVKFFLLY